MQGLKIDLINELRTKKYYEELELFRLGREPNMNYKKKIKQMSHRLKKLVILNSQISLLDVYFKETENDNNKPLHDD